MKPSLLLTIALAQPLSALTIQIDYTYDTTNFFDTQEKRDAVESVAKFYGDMIRDHLLRIDPAENPGNSWTARPTHPATGLTIDIPNLVVPADTIIVYVGARQLGDTTRGVAGPGGWSGSGFSNWFNLVRGRGSAGAAVATATARTDFSPWGGSMAFDIDSSWNFSKTQNLSGTDFISIALHEMGHVLGIGTADSWKNQISSSIFTGDAAARSHGSAPTLQAGGSHFSGTVTTSESFGAFNVEHGSIRQVLMLPTLTDDNTNLIVASDLDLAGFVDIGWEISPPQPLNITALSPAGAAFTWSSSSFFDYKIQRSTTLGTFPDGSGTIAGTGLTLSWNDPAPPANTAFYRLAATEAFPQPQSIPAPSMAPSQTYFTTASDEPRMVENCGHSAH